MALAVRSTASQGDGSANGIEPTGAANGDLIVMLFNNPFSGTALTPPAGWTEVLDANYNSTFCRWGAFWIVRGSSAPSYTVGGGNGSSQGIFTFAITGADTTTPMDASPPALATKSGADPDSPSITTVTADTLLIVATGNDASSQTITAPTGFTEITQVGGCTAAYKAQAATGATGTFAWTSASQEWGSLTLAIRPAGGGGGGTAVPVFYYHLQQQGIA